MISLRFPYRKCNRTNALLRKRDFLIEIVLQYLPVSELMRLSTGGKMAKFIPDVAFRKLPSELIDAASRPDIEKRLFFTHSDPFFAAGALMRKCCFVSSHLRISQFISMFLKEFKNRQTIELTQRLPRLVLGFFVCLHTYDKLPEYWELDEDCDILDGGSSEVRERQEMTIEKRRTFEEWGYESEFNICLWKKFPMEWQIFSGLEQKDWRDERTNNLVNDMFVCLSRMSDKFVCSAKESREFKILAASIIAGQATHGSTGKRCQCTSCMNMLNTFLIIHKNSIERTYSAEEYAAARVNPGLNTSNMVGYWPKGVYLRLFPFLNVWPDWKLVIEKLYEYETIDMASLMDNLFLEDLFISLGGRPLLMRDIVLALLRNDNSDGDRTVYEQAARDIILISISQIESVAILSQFVDSLRFLYVKIAVKNEGFFEIILNYLTDYKQRTLGANEDVQITSDDVLIPPRNSLIDSLILEVDMLISEKATHLTVTDHFDIHKLIETGKKDEIDGNLFFTEQDLFYAAGKGANMLNWDMDTIKKACGILKETCDMNVYRKVPRMLIGIILGDGFWKDFPADWRSFLRIDKSDDSCYESDGKTLKEDSKKASHMLCRIMSIAEARDPELAKLFFIAVLVANTEDGQFEFERSRDASEVLKCKPNYVTFWLFLSESKLEYQHLPSLMYYYEYENLPGHFTTDYRGPTCLSSILNIYALWGAIVEDVREDGRIDIYQLIEMATPGVFGFLLCTRPDTLLVDYVLNPNENVGLEGIACDFLTGLKFATTIARNPDKFRWNGREKNPSLGEVFSMYSKALRRIYEELQPSVEFFENLDHYSNELLENHTRNSMEIPRRVPFPIDATRSYCLVARDFISAELDYLGIERERSANRA